MEYVILDLEWNGTFSRRLNGFFNEIIEFGAVKVDGSLRIVDTFSMVVRPQIGKKLSGKVKRLTNISNEELDLGVPFTRALSLFRRFLGNGVLMTWGTSDILTLMENNRYYAGTDRLTFIKQYADLQRFCEIRLCYDAGQQMGLSTAAQMLGISEDGVDHHRALDDSLLSLACMRRIFDEESFCAVMQDADKDEFYDRMRFKTTILCDLNNPLIDRSVMYFDCDICGQPARQVSDWEIKNKSYRAHFTCAHCQREFIGRIQFKLKYEGIVVKKRLVPVQQEEEPDEAERDEPDEAEQEKEEILC